MPDPRRYTDAHLERAFFADAFDDTDLGALVDPRECACWHEALRHASATSSPEYGLHFPDFDGCRRTERFADGAIELCCSNGALISDALSRLGFNNKALDRELLRRLELAERVAQAQARSLDIALSILNLKGVAA